MQLRTIVVGLDGSRNSDRAATVAGDLAELTGAEVVAVHAVGLLEAQPGTDQVRADRLREIRDDMESRWTERLQRDGVTHRCELRDGNPNLVLLATATDVGAELIVVGRQGHGSFPEQVLGSTSAAIAATASCAVLIVPEA